MSIKAFHKRRAAHSKKKKTERRTEAAAAAAQVITKTEYKSKTLSMAFIIARFVDRERKAERDGELVSTAGAFGWTIGHRDETATDFDCDYDWLPAWPLVLSLTLSLSWL